MVKYIYNIPVFASTTDHRQNLTSLRKLRWSNIPPYRSYIEIRRYIFELSRGQTDKVTRKQKHRSKQDNSYR